MDRSIKRSLRSELLGSLGVEGADIPVKEEVEVVEEGDTASAAATDGVTEQVEIDKAVDTAEALSDAVDAGEELEAAVEAAVAGNRPLTKIEAAQLKLTMNNITKGFIPRSDRLLPAQESFGGTHDRQEQTVLACEAIKETFREFWEAIKAQFLKVVTQIRGAVKGFFDKSAATVKRAEAVSARAQQTNGNAENSKIQLNTSGVAVGGEVSGQLLTAGIGNVLNLVTAVVKVESKSNLNAEVDLMVGALDKSLAGQNNELQAIINDANKEVNVGGGAINSNKTAPATIAARYGEGAVASGVLPGDRAVVTVPGGEGKNAFGYEVLIGVNDGKKGETNKEVPVLSIQEIVKISDDIAEANGIIAQFNKAFARNEEAAKKLVVGIDKLSAKAEKSDTGAGEEVKSDVSRAFKVQVSAVTNYIRRREAFIGNVVSYTNNVSNSVLSYCERSLGEYKTK